MPDSVKYTFAAGEIAPTLLGRSDIEAYDMSVAEAVNFFVDPRGGLSNRSGTLLKHPIYGRTNFVLGNRGVDYVYPLRLMPFRWMSIDQDEGQFLIILGPPPADYVGDLSVIRIMDHGEYVTDASPVIGAAGISQEASARLTMSPDPGWVAGTMLQLTNLVAATQHPLNNQIVYVNPLGGGVYSLRDECNIVVESTTFPALTSGVANHVVTIDAPYSAYDRAFVKYSQKHLALDLTCPAYQPRRLSVSDAGVWTLTSLTFGPTVARPTTPTLTASGAGTAGVAFCVTAVSADGEESLPSNYAFNVLSVDYTTVAGSMRVTWPAIAGAKLYKIYRTRILSIGADISRAEQMGYVGFSYGPSFTDRNYTPDFTITPPLGNDPFASGAIEYIDVTAGGAGYTRASTVTASIGTGLIAQPVVDSTGVILGIAVLNGGKNYTAASVVTVSVGAGATFSHSVTPSSGNKPRANAAHQQRKVYAGASNHPQTVVGSKPRLFENFDVSTLVLASDAYSFNVDSEDATPITDLNSTRSGLLMWSGAGLWELSGGDGAAITPTNVLAQPQSYTGVQQNLAPLPIGPNFLYAETKSGRVRFLEYTSDRRVYEGLDLMQLAPHLANADNQIISWDYAGDPYGIVYAVREDGTMLMLTLQKEAGIYGWTRFQTRGRVLQVVVLTETLNDLSPPKDVVYLCIERVLPRGNIYTIETLSPRDFEMPDEVQFLDGAVTTSVTYDSQLLTVFADVEPGETTIITEFLTTPVLVGDIFRGGGGKWEVDTNVIPAFNVTCLRKPERHVTQHITGSDTIRIPGGSYTLSTPSTTFNGLWLYRGLTVSIVADGNVLADQVVPTLGSITLSESASLVSVGFKHLDYVKPLPAKIEGDIAQGRLKSAKRLSMRVYDSRGIQTGKDLDHLFPIKETQPELNGQAIPLQRGVKPAILDTPYDYDGSFYIVQEYPLPCTILSFTANLEVGDPEDA